MVSSGGGFYELFAHLGSTVRARLVRTAGMLRVYVYERCSTCRKALRWLEERAIAHEVRPIRETPPPPEELAAMLGHYDGERKRLLNTSSADYREAGLKDRLADMGNEELFALMQENGNLVRRPFVLGEDVGVVGFREAEWETKLA